MNKLKIFSFIIISALFTTFIIFPACKAEPEVVIETVVKTVTETVTETVEVEKEVPDEAKLIVYVTPCITAFYGWNMAHEAFLQSCKEYGYIGSVVGDNNVDPVTMVEFFQQGVSGGADAIVVYPVEPAAFEGPYKEASEKNIPIVETAIDSNADEVINWVGTDAINAGRFAGQKCVEGTEGKANVLISMTGPGNKNQDAWIAGFKEVIADSPDIEVITEVFTKSTTDVAVEVIGNALTAYPEIDFIYCVEGFSPAAAATVVKEKGLVGEVRILAIDKAPETIDFIKEGVIWGTLDQGFSLWGTVPVEQLTNYWNEEPVERRVDSGLVFYDINNIE